LQESLTASRRTLEATNPIELTLTVPHPVTAHVTRLRDGDVRRRKCAADLLMAESKFLRVKGSRAMPDEPETLDASV